MRKGWNVRLVIEIDGGGERCFIHIRVPVDLGVYGSGSHSAPARSQDNLLAVKSCLGLKDSRLIHVAVDEDPGMLSKVLGQRIRCSRNICGLSPKSCKASRR